MSAALDDRALGHGNDEQSAEAARKRRGGRGSNNPLLRSVAADANARRAKRAGRRQAEQAQRCLDQLAGEARQQWIAVLRLRVERPDASLRELAAAMDPPITKDAYGALYRRAVEAAQRVTESSGTNTAQREAESLRSVLLKMLRSGGAMTTATLRARAHEGGLDGVSSEAVYRQLQVLSDRGEIRNLGRRGRHVYWVHHSSPAATTEAFGEQ